MSDDLSGFSMHELFKVEAESQLAILSNGLLALEAENRTAETFESLMRAAHSLKGAARIVGVDCAGKIAHVLEDCFVEAQHGRIVFNEADIDLLLQGVDSIDRIAKLDENEIASWEVDHADEIDRLVARLAAIAAGTKEESRAANAIVEPESRPAEDESSAFADSLQEPDRVEEVQRDRAIEDFPGPSAESDESNIDQLVSQSKKDTEIADLATRSNVVMIDENENVREKKIESGESESKGEDRSVATRPRRPPRDEHDASDGVVRVSAASLSRLTALAGESLVESRRLRPFVAAIGRLRRRQTMVLEGLRAVEDKAIADFARYGAAVAPSVVAVVPGGAAIELLARAKEEALRCLELVIGQTEELESLARRMEDVADRLNHEVLKSRMRPFGEGIKGFPRLVRDVARQLGKSVRLEVEGESTGVDRDILDKIESPLNHMIRNSIDHGIETPDEREAAGKPATATIRLEARHRAGMLQITLSDDGRGIDLEKLRRRVVERGLLGAAPASRLSESELLDFLFLPGFTTKDEVSTVSGRGVGLDAVLTTAREIGGTIRIQNRPGRGVRFILQSPITKSVVRGLLVEIDREPYAFPLNRIDRITALQADQIQRLEGYRHFLMEGEPVGLVDAAGVLELGVSPVESGVYQVVVVSDRSHRFGLIVDRILGERDMEARPLDPRLGKVPNFNSASVLEDGRPVLIFDVEDLVRSIDHLLESKKLGRSTEIRVGEAKSKTTKRVLVVEDSITVRELERQLLEAHGYLVDVAVDGVDGWNAVRSRDYHLVISDVDMPRMNGLELVARIKREPRLSRVPVVIVSYKERDEDRLRGLDAGANAYLTKSSFRDQTFLETVIDLIGESNR